MEEILHLDGWNRWKLINNGLDQLSTGAGFLPSTVCCDMFWYMQIHVYTCGDAALCTCVWIHVYTFIYIYIGMILLYTCTHIVYGILYMWTILYYTGAIFLLRSKGARGTGRILCLFQGHVGARCWPAPLAIAGPITWPRRRSLKPLLTCALL